MSRRRPAMFAVAADTVLEAVRGRWPLLVALAAALVAGVAWFAGALALTEAPELRLSFAAALARLAGAFIVVLGVVASMARERSERTLHLALAAPMERSTWLAGKLAGFCVQGVLTALVLSLPLWIMAPGVPVLAWTLSYALELCLLASVCLAISTVVVPLPAAIAASVAFYVLARVWNVVQLLGERSANFSDQGWLSLPVRLLAPLVPRLDLFARTDWLLGVPPTGPEAPVLLAQAVVFTTLAFAAAALDLRRAALR